MRTLIGIILSLAFIAVATLRPVDGAPSSVGMYCLLCGSFGVPDLVLNVLLFAPLGYFLGQRRLSWLQVMGVGLLLSAGIEAAQSVLPGRSPTFRDILVNGFGAGLGALVAQRLSAWLLPSRRTTALMWIAAGGVGLAVGLTGWLHRFSPREGTYFAHWVTRQGHLADWDGSVDSATVFGTLVPPGRQREATSKSLRTWLRDSVEARVVAVAGSEPASLAGIFTITTGDMEEILLIGADRGDLVVRVRRAAADVRMREPVLRFPGALKPIRQGEPLRITVSASTREACATVNEVRHCTARPAAGSVWTLAIDSLRQPNWVRQALNASSLAILSLPFFLLWPAAPRPHRLGAAPTLLAGIVAIAATTGLATPSIWEWLGIGISWLFGAAVFARAHRSAAGTNELR